MNDEFLRKKQAEFLLAIAATYVAALVFYIYVGLQVIAIKEGNKK